MRRSSLSLADAEKNVAYIYAFLEQTTRLELCSLLDAAKGEYLNGIAYGRQMLSFLGATKTREASFEKAKKQLETNTVSFFQLLTDFLNESESWEDNSANVVLLKNVLRKIMQENSLPDQAIENLLTTEMIKECGFKLKEFAATALTSLLDQPFEKVLFPPKPRPDLPSVNELLLEFSPNDSLEVVYDPDVRAPRGNGPSR